MIFNDVNLKSASKPRRIYLFVGSYGDLYDIASFLTSILTLNPDILIVADYSYYDLLRVFLGNRLLDDFVIFSSNISLQRKRQIYSLHTNQSTSTLTTCSGIKVYSSIMADHRAVRNSFNHDHIDKVTVYNSIFSTSHMCSPCLPSFFTPEDYLLVDTSLFSIREKMTSMPSILFTVNTNTHYNFTDDQVLFIVKRFQESSVLPVLNLHGLTDSQVEIFSSICPSLSLQGHLMSILIQMFDCISGTMGGALNVAHDFTTTNIVSVLTPDAHCNYLDRMGVSLINDNSQKVAIINNLNSASISHSNLDLFINKSIEYAINSFRKRSQNSLSSFKY